MDIVIWIKPKPEFLKQRINEIEINLPEDNSDYDEKNLKELALFYVQKKVVDENNKPFIYFNDNKIHYSKILAQTDDKENSKEE